MPNIDWIEIFEGDRGADRSPSIRLEDAQVCFEVGDKVRFSSAKGSRLTGTVEKLNPKRARVRCGVDVWVVPYTGLDHPCGSTARDRAKRATRLKDVAVQARELMDRHGLREWTLRFNAAQKKLGECRPRQKLILLSRSHAVNGPPGQVTDTILQRDRSRPRRTRGGPRSRLEGHRQAARRNAEIVRTRKRRGAPAQGGRQGEFPHRRHRLIHRPRSHSDRRHRAHEPQARQGEMRRRPVVGALRQAQRDAPPRPRSARGVNGLSDQTFPARRSAFARPGSRRVGTSPLRSAFDAAAGSARRPCSGCLDARTVDFNEATLSLSLSRRILQFVNEHGLRDGKGRTAQVADVLRLPAARRLHTHIHVVGDRDVAHGESRCRLPGL